MEVLDVYDQDKNKLGKTIIRDIDKPLENEYILVTHIYIINEEDKILMQKRSANKKSLPNSWYPTAGFVSSGEDSYITSIREIKEEIGIDIDFKKLKYIDFVVVKNKIIDIYVLKQNIKLDECTIQTSEVATIDYLDKLEVIKIMQQYSICSDKYLECLKKI